MTPGDSLAQLDLLALGGTLKKSKFPQHPILILLGLLTISACGRQWLPTASTTANPLPDVTPIPTSAPTHMATPISIPLPTPIPISAPRYGFRIVNVYPHDPGAYTEGLVYDDGFLLEGTGLRGRSNLRRVELISGEIVKSVTLDPEIFGEGITLLDDHIIQLTLTSGLGFVYDQQSFEKLDEFIFAPEGWGLTHDGRLLIMGDGTPELRFLDPNSFQEIHRISVADDGQPIPWLNELEYVEGEIYANVWQTDWIARISPETGDVLGWIDLSRLRGNDGPTGALNGIAYDAESRRLFVTGKNWPELFEIELIREAD